MSKSHKKRSLAKTLTWRIIATSDTFLISWIITGAATLAGAIAGIEVVRKCFYITYMKEVGIKLNGQNKLMKDIRQYFLTMMHLNIVKFIKKKLKRNNI